VRYLGERQRRRGHLHLQVALHGRHIGGGGGASHRREEPVAPDAGVRQVPAQLTPLERREVGQPLGQSLGEEVQLPGNVHT